jgi:hypothetical protein
MNIAVFSTVLLPTFLLSDSGGPTAVIGSNPLLLLSLLCWPSCCCFHSCCCFLFCCYGQSRYCCHPCCCLLLASLLFLAFLLMLAFLLLLASPLFLMLSLLLAFLSVAFAPAVAGLLAVANISADPGVPILAAWCLFILGCTSAYTDQ